MAAATNGTVSSAHGQNGTSGGATPPKLLRTRLQTSVFRYIVLEELKLPFEETIIDLDTPRPHWYLDINPGGLVPSIKYTVPGLVDSEIIYESAIVAQFLCDAFPSHLLPSSHEDPLAPLGRARINFFVDTWSSKLSAFQMAAMKAPVDEKQAKVDEWAAAVEKEIEPLLADAGPFFGGSKELTFAEAIVAPFLLRWYAFANDKYVPASLVRKLDALPNCSKWSKAVREKESVTKIWDRENYVEAFAKKYGNVLVAMR